MQVKHNPFGDYAPASTQIQGILKNMYDTMIGDLQDGNATEGNIWTISNVLYTRSHLVWFRARAA